MSLLRGKKRWVAIVTLVGAMIVSALVVVAFSFAFMLYWNYDERVNGAKAEITQNDIEREFQTISALPLALAVQHGSMHKTQQGITSAAYKTKSSYEVIRAHYDNELASRGWRFVSEDKVIYDGKDYGGKERLYCKGRYPANLQYAGRQEREFDWTYSFGLTWGPSDGCK